MTRNDLLWRLAGAALTLGAACGAGAWEGASLAVALLPVALAGLTLALNGKRVPVALRAELRGHPYTAAAIHHQRLRRRQRDRA